MYQEVAQSTTNLRFTTSPASGCKVPVLWTLTVDVSPTRQMGFVSLCPSVMLCLSSCVFCLDSRFRLYIYFWGNDPQWQWGEVWLVGGEAVILYVFHFRHVLLSFPKPTFVSRSDHQHQKYRHSPSALDIAVVFPSSQTEDTGIGFRFTRTRTEQLACILASLAQIPPCFGLLVVGSLIHKNLSGYFRFLVLSYSYTVCHNKNGEKCMGWRCVSGTAMFASNRIWATCRVTNPSTFGQHVFKFLSLYFWGKRKTCPAQTLHDCFVSICGRAQSERERERERFWTIPGNQ